MKIDAVLARHPWPWRAQEHPKNAYVWEVLDRLGGNVLDSKGTTVRLRDAVLELIAAHVASQEGKEDKK